MAAPVRGEDLEPIVEEAEVVGEYSGVRPAGMQHHERLAGPLPLVIGVHEADVNVGTHHDAPVRLA